MTDFHRRIPTYSRRLWFFVAVAFGTLALAIAGLVSLDEGVVFWPITICLAVVSVGSVFDVLRRRRNPDVTECRLADGQVYWHTPAPRQSTVQIALTSISTLVIDEADASDMEEDGQERTITITLNDGQQLRVPDRCLRRHWMKFVRAVRDNAPHIRVKQYGTPLFRV